MVYAYDQWLPMPTKDLFDTLMMLASVNAAKDMYEKGLEEMKEFNKEYGDFLSPIDKDMLWTNDYVLQPMRDTINSMYENGIDPLRTKEGRSLLAQMRARIDTGRMARNKQSAEMAKEYLKNRDELIQKHLYDPDYEAWRLNGNTLENFDSSKGVWTESSPMPLRDVDSIVEPWVANLEPSFDPEYTKAQNDGYDYDTVSKERIMAVIDDQLPEFSKTSEGGYYRHLAEELSGGDKEAGDLLLKTWLYNRASDHTQIDRKINPEYQMKLLDYYDALQTDRQAQKEIDVYHRKKIIDGMFGGGSGLDGLTYDPLLRIYLDAVGNIFGGGYDIYKPGTLNADGTTTPSEQEKNIAEQLKRLTQGIPDEDIINTFSREDAMTFDMFAGAADAMDRTNEGSISAISTDVNKLLSTSQLINNTVTAKPRSRWHNLTDEVDKAAERMISKNYRSCEITPTGRVYGALMRDGRFKTYAQVYVTRYDKDDNAIGRIPMWYDLQVQSGRTANWKDQPAILTPDANDHSLLARSRKIAHKLYNTKATTDDLELVPETAQPK